MQDNLTNSETVSNRMPGKRGLDLVLSSLALVLLSPLLMVATLWVRIVSPGPVFFTQWRIGLDGKPFRVFKLRTMSVASPNETRQTVSVRNDPRMFSGSSLLRRLKIDELPQLFNVLRGEMSLVGPRPTIQEDYDHMTTEQRCRCKTLPGMTGLAQIYGNTSLLWPERIEHDLDYLRRQSVWLDLTILAKTALLVFTGRSHTDPPSDNEWSAAA